MSPTCSKCKSKMYLNKVLEKHSLLAPCSSNSGFISATKEIVNGSDVVENIKVNSVVGIKVRKRIKS